MRRPAIMGILNVTPDSFSGDGVLSDEAIRYAHQLMVDGADILDIGAESTRPNAMPLDADMECARLGPVLEGIIAHEWRMRVRLSVDTRHAQTASRALALGVDIINDVSGFADEEMLEVLDDHSCDIVTMHALSVPADSKVTLPEDCDVVAEILKWKEAVTCKATNAGIGAERLIYDPGIGFGKTAKQSLALIESAKQLTSSGGRWLFGHSRKSFLTLITNAPAAERDAATLTYSKQLAEDGVDYLRVHNVALHTQYFGQ